MPFVALTTVVPRSSIGAAARMTSATPWVGMATTTSSAPCERLIERGGRLKMVGEAHVGQVHGVGAARVHLARERRISGPQAHGVPQFREVHCQGGAPAAAAEHGRVLHGRTRTPIRRSVPLLSRTRLERCRNTMTAAAPSAAATAARGASIP